MADIGTGTFRASTQAKLQRQRKADLSFSQRLDMLEEMHETLAFLQGSHDQSALQNHTSNPLRQLRQQVGLSQQDLARNLGISKAAVSQMERNPNPRWQTVQKYAAACGQLARIEFKPLIDYQTG